MNEHVYNATEVLAVLDAIVASKPAGYRYSDDPNTRYMSQTLGQPVTQLERDATTWCEYFRPDGSPACIVGHVLDRLAIPFPEDSNETPFNQVCDTDETVAQYFTGEAIEVLYQTQYKQDLGSTWEGAVEYGRTYAR